jgi:hypothetical protein
VSYNDGNTINNFKPRGNMETRIEKVTQKDADRSEKHLQSCLRNASRETLTGTLMALSENIVKTASECSDATTNRFLAADLTVALLEKNGAKFEKAPGKNPSFNGDWVSDVAIVFGIRKDMLGGSENERRLNKIKQMVG